MDISKPFTTFLELLVPEIATALLHHGIVDNALHLPQDATPKIHHEHSYGTVDEWLQHFKNKTQLSEEIYKRDKWKQYIGAKDSVELRQKLKGKSLSELAQILVRLDHM